MRRRLAIGAVVALVIGSFAFGVLLFIPGPVVAPVVWTATLLIGILGVVLGIIGVVFAIVFPLFGTTPRTGDVAAAAAAGREGLARVLSASPTGTQINGQWVYDVDLVVDQTRVPAYRTRDRIRVHRNDGTLRGGEIISVVRLRDDAPQVAVIAGPARSPQDALVPKDAPPWA